MEKNGKFLLLHNIARDRWELPGGKVDENEKFVQAAMRETEEETGILIGKTENLVWMSTETININGVDWTGIYFYATWFFGEGVVVEPNKHDKLGWFTLEEIERLPQIPLLTYKQVKRYLMHQNFKRVQESNINKFFKDRFNKQE